MSQRHIPFGLIHTPPSGNPRGQMGLRTEKWGRGEIGAMQGNICAGQDPDLPVPKQQPPMEGLPPSHRWHFEEQIHYCDSQNTPNAGKTSGE